jgi:anti-sigma-K factor RskA
MTDVASYDGDERPLAGEYVLGVLDADERARAQARIASEPAFARAVAWWENRLAPLAARVAPVEPPATIWPRIAHLIGATETPRRSAWNSVGLWRGAALGAFALAAASLVALIVTPRPAPTPAIAPAKPAAATEVAVISDPATQRPALVATLDRAADKLILTPVSIKLPTARDAELWIIPQGQKPISLGVIPSKTQTRVALPAGLRGAAAYTATLAVSDEPLGGSPTGAPTGQIRAAGKFQQQTG